MAMSNFVATAKLNGQLHTLSYHQVWLINELLLLDAAALFGWIENVDKDGKTHLIKRPYSKPDIGEKQLAGGLLNRLSLWILHWLDFLETQCAPFLCKGDR